jgi:hypothetical protein
MKTFPPLNSALIGLARAPPTLALGLAPPPQKKSETTPRDLRNVGSIVPNPRRFSGDWDFLELAGAGL